VPGVELRPRDDLLVVGSRLIMRGLTLSVRQREGEGKKGWRKADALILLFSLHTSLQGLEQMPKDGSSHVSDIGLLC
jgi:hypothetical protein